MAVPQGSGADNGRWVRHFADAPQPEHPIVHGWQTGELEHAGLLMGTLEPDSSVGGGLSEQEIIVVPLSGSCRVQALGPGVTEGSGDAEAVILDEVTLAGRREVFSGPTDIAYLPPGQGIGYAVMSIDQPVRVAICRARVSRPQASDAAYRITHLAAADVPVELRGAGVCSREVRNLGTPEVLDAERIIACEVLTPAGNWSSYPPHKHDEERPGEETALEEIYYFETRPAGSDDIPDPHRVPQADLVGYQRVYGTGDRPIDVLAEVRTGDVVLVPHGWHGPSMAAPDADLYYLNVMAGPGAERAWRICYDPAHDGVRAAWAGQPVDPRLPLGAARNSPIGGKRAGDGRTG
ncbi:MAG: 5-deoxy-glucuronate isomerase [Micrococcales bacterium]|nr:5-deoxy-glucuronate isomerase [Micrococcales bacterium]